MEGKKEAKERTGTREEGKEEEKKERGKVEHVECFFLKEGGKGRITNKEKRIN